MAKFSGKIGFSITTETIPGVWTNNFIEKTYRGDILSDWRKSESSNNSTNDGLILNNKISIVSNNYILSNSKYMKYVTYLGEKWKITNVEVARPRLIITLGGLFNE